MPSAHNSFDNNLSRWVNSVQRCIDSAEVIQRAHFGPDFHSVEGSFAQTHLSLHLQQRDVATKGRISSAGSISNHSEVVTRRQWCAAHLFCDEHLLEMHENNPLSRGSGVERGGLIGTSFRTHRPECLSRSSCRQHCWPLAAAVGSARRRKWTVSA